jgi:uncharacterized protein (TIGR03435 family)
MRAIRGAFLTVMACCAIRAQTCDIAFDAVSVKVAQPGPGRPIGSIMSGGPGSNDPSRLDWINIPLLLILTEAYNVKGFQISGPDWLDSKVDVAATLPKDSTKEQFRLMLRHLLMERFQLKLHHENREGATYSLVVARGGPKMKESSGEPIPAPPAGPRKMEKDENGFPLFPLRPGVSQASDGPRIRWRVRQLSMRDLAGWLSNHLRHAVTDDTGLQGKFDFILTYANQGWAGPSSPETETTTDLIGAMAQIGLKLEQKKATIDTLVIDHMERVPSEN